jgi:hypothetical protein
MIICPACRRQAFSLKQKMLLGPLPRVECPSCMAAVTVAWPAYIVWPLAAFVALALPALLGAGIAARVALFVVGYALAALFHLKCVPLVAKRIA